MARQPGRLTRRDAIALAILAAVLGLAAAFVVRMIGMPGHSFRGPLPPLDANQARLAAELRDDVAVLATEIGERNLFRPVALARAADWIEAELRAAGHDPQRHSFDVAGKPYRNIVIELPGRDRTRDIIVVGAHYDSAPGTPGANDNASGVAALLALARRMRGGVFERTVRLAWFSNEEPPHFETNNMGSLRYARRSAERGERIAAMLSLETMGYYSDAPDSQRYPGPLAWLYPSTGNFIGFVGDTGSRALVRRAIAAFRAHARFPSEGAALPRALPGVGWSDHWAFWQHGYPAIMVTDTAPFRYPHYHLRSDTAEKLDYERLARVTGRLQAVIGELASAAQL